MNARADAPASEIASFRHSVLRLSRRLRKQAGIGLTPSQMSALSTLERAGPIRVGELARREQVSKSSITRMAANLEAQGLIRRTVDPEDGRGFLVALTPRGTRLLAEAGERQNAYLRRQIAAMEPDDARRLLTALESFEKLLAVKA